MLSRPLNSLPSIHVHDQTTPAATWIVAHGLNRQVSVTTLDSAGAEFIADVVHIDRNTINVISAFPCTGKAICN